MNKNIIAAAVAIALVTGMGIANAQTTTTTTTWSNDHGQVLQSYSTTQKYTPINDPAIVVNEGVVLPGTVEIHPLPPTIMVDQPNRYSYTIINQKPVVVERESRRVVRVW